MAVTFNGTLCDGDADGFDGHRDLEVSGQDATQNEAVIDSDYPYFAGRGNSVFTVSFSASKRHATPEAAAAYCGTHVNATRGQASFSGFGLSLDAAVCTARVRQKGNVTEASYTITGSKTPAA